MAFIQEIDVKNEMNLSFAGCGFLGIYHVGVASCIKEHAPHLVTHKIAGASAGAIAAVGLICNVDLGKATTQVLQVALKARSYALGPLHPTFNIVNFVEGLLDDFLPFNAHELASGRMHISLTRMYDRKNVIVNQFDTRDDLIQALICSAYIPFYCGLFPPQYKGTYYLDGGLSNNIPILDEHTITVSPFAGESDICPSDNSASELHVFLANTSIQLSTSNLYRFGCIVFPPRPETLSKMCQQGFDDCLVFLQKNTLITCKRHLSIYTSMTTDGTPFTEAQMEKLHGLSGHDSVEDVQNISSDENVMTDTEDEVCSSNHPQQLLPPCLNAPRLSMIASDSRESLISDDESVHNDSHFGDSEHDEEEDDEDEEDHTCEECTHRRHVAVIESLPQPVVTALQAATDSVNSTILGRLYKFKAARVLGVMASPWFLSFEVTCTLAKKFHQWAPYMPSDMTWFVREFVKIIRELYEFVQASRHRYSSRYVCQLAITDIDYPSESKDRHSLPTFTPIKQSLTRRRLLAQRRRSLNLGFAVDFAKNSINQDPIECVNEFRQHLLDEEDKDIDITEIATESEEYNPRMEHVFRDEHGKTHVHLPKVSQFSQHRDRRNSKSNKTNKNIKNEATKNGSNNSKEENSSISNDSFDNCLHVASQMESILSYYYTEEGDPQTVKVAEIYALGDPTGPSPQTSVTNLSMDWDSFMEMKKESPQSTMEEVLHGESVLACDRLFSKVEEDTILGIGEDVSSSSQPFALLADVSRAQMTTSLSESIISVDPGGCGGGSPSGSSGVVVDEVPSPIVSTTSPHPVYYTSTPNNNDNTKLYRRQQNVDSP